MRAKNEQYIENYSPNAEYIQTIFKTKLFNEFNYDLPNNQHPKLIYEQLCNERDLFTFSFRKDYYFSKSWRRCVLYEASFQPLFSKEKNKFNPKKDEAIIFYNNLLTNPNAMDKKTLMRGFTILCQIDAYASITLICKKHPNLPIDFSLLLSIAIGSLNLSTVEVLIDLGAPLHKPLLYLQDPDNGINIFCSPLYYALILPENPQSTIGRFGRVLSLDNPKLLNILNCLLLKGADPLQKCICTPCDIFNLEQTEIQEEIDLEQTEIPEEI